MSTQTRSAPNIGAPKKFAAAKSLSEQLDVCPRTIFRWADAGKIARHKVSPRLVLFDVGEVLHVIESSRATHELSPV